MEVMEKKSLNPYSTGSWLLIITNLFYQMEKKVVLILILLEVGYW